MPSERLIHLQLIPLRVLHDAFHGEPGNPFEDRLHFPLDAQWHPDLSAAFRGNRKAQKTTVVYPRRGISGFRIRVAHGEGWLDLPTHLERHLVKEDAFSVHLRPHLGPEQLEHLQGE